MFLVIFLIKLDLVTGFLGSGKTTFIKDYVKYLKSIGESVCVIVNDHGGVNVDNLFLSNIVDTESIVSDTDPNTTYRRYKTKLIACMLKHYTRVVIEPSGVFDTDSFFDLAYEDTICNNYTISNIFAIMEENYIKDSLVDNILVNETSHASKIIVTKGKGHKTFDINYLNQIHQKAQSTRTFKEEDLIYKEDIDFKNLMNCSYKSCDYIKKNINIFETIFVLKKKKSIDNILEISHLLFSDNSYGKILRMKGFIKNTDGFISINLTKNNTDISKTNIGQEVFIIIGYNMVKEKILKLFD